MDAHLRDLRYFLTVAEELSFTRAAERLHLSQPALSKQIQGLERTLRAALFDRGRRQVRLTAAGEALLAVARRVLTEWDDGTVEVGDIVAEQLRTLRVGTLTSIGRTLYREAVNHFATRRPGWRIELRSFGWGDPTAGLHDHATDVAFLWLPVDAEDISYHILLSERRFVTLSNQHRLAHRTTVLFQDLLDEPFVALPHSAGPLRDFWLGADQRPDTPVTVVAEVTNADEKLELIASDTAIGLVAESNAAIYARPDLVSIPVTDLGPAQLAVAHRRGDRRQAVQAFTLACTDAIRNAYEPAANGAEVPAPTKHPAR
ncbi:MAG: LysR family transcriptional regulator [Actinophytocola sp.]|uniref:LysR family transcriptional regulator n=1 Tax=Actinophytocola sp. TaxID=1872138 RepID=UPI003D6AEE0A